MLTQNGEKQFNCDKKELYNVRGFFDSVPLKSRVLYLHSSASPAPSLLKRFGA